MSIEKETEHEQTLNRHGLALRASLRLPVNGPAKHVVLMIPGSGEVDRNENGMKLQLNTFNAIADSLEEVGIASLRYDKRGCAQSEGSYNETGFYDFVDDAQAWLESLDSIEELNGAQRILLGHSEGTLISAMLCIEKPELAGQVLLNPFLENLEQVIERQMFRTLEEVRGISGFKGFVIKAFLRLSGDQLKKQRRLVKRVKNSGKATLKVGRQTTNAKWLRELMSINPADVYSKVTVPTMCVGGKKDIQCIPKDADDIAALIEAPTESVIFDELTHILRIDEQEPSIFRYKELTEKPIDTRVLDAVIKWVQR